MDPATILEMEKATFLKKVLEVLHGQFSKANFAFSSTGLELQAMDPKCFALVVLQLHSKAFRSDICNNGDLSVGLNLAEMDKAFNFANNDDSVTIKAKDGEEAVFITFTSPDGSLSEYFKLSFVGVDLLVAATQEYLESEYQAIIRMPSTEFMHFCNQLSCFAGDMETVAVRISVDKDCVNFYTAGILGALTIMYQLIQTADKSGEATDIKENVSLAFGLRYLISLGKAFTLSREVTIKLSSKLPAVFEYNIPEMGYIRYYVMPIKV